MKDSFLNSFRKFLGSEIAGGVILFFFVLVSLFIANSPLKTAFEEILDTPFGFNTENLHLRYPLLLWINDGLMAIFFLLVGLEIKKELVQGELSSPKKAALPILAAIGGALVPAFIYILLNQNSDTAAGWGIPMATDIAFALAIITLLGKRVPPALKIFLAALAIVDDLLAILVIAVFYTSELHTTYLLYAAGILVLLIAFNKLGVTNIFMYILPGVFIWYFVHHSGIHATIAGVAVAMTIPLKAKNGTSPLIHLEHLLSKPVNFLIMPIFALANTNIHFESKMVDGLATPLGLGIILGLVLGKPIGISLISALAVKLKLSVLPSGVQPLHIVGVGLIAGIGFTMSIFIALLSFAGNQHLLAEAKFSILLASLISGVLGSAFLIRLQKKH